jgi:hypothetical protein
MSRHSFFPAITLAVCLLVPATIFAQNTNQTKSPIDVLYFVTNNTIQTYNVDPGYGNATLYGTLTVPAPSNTYPIFVPGANDHYIYVWCACGTGGTDLQVYATDSNGAPQGPPIQALRFKTAFRNFVIDPNGSLAYAAEPLQNSAQLPESGIRAFAIDPNTGILTPFPTLSAIEYPPPGETICTSSNPFGPGYFSLAGFNVAGTRLTDVWGCGGYDDSEDYYYTRAVNVQTGALGPDVPTVGAGSSEDTIFTVTFTPTSILSFTNYGFEGSQNELDVYWPNATLDFSCTYTIFDACSYSGGVTADRSGKFVFFYTDTGATEVARLNMTKKTFEPVGIPLADTINTFSLDDKLIYGFRTLSWNGEYVTPVYVFDPSTGLVTDNGMTITMPNESSILIPALRY